jgi:glycosyltransferase involved in cell wall biosynthesis
MIVKNEAHVIHEALECTLPLIDTYCIVDTGSSDDTISKIKTFYDSRGISGKVHERPWVDFGTNRSEAIKLCDGEMDYILVIDADDLMTFPENGRDILTKLLKTKPSNLTIDIHQGTLIYTRSQIFKANDGWYYKGVLHEYPTNGKQTKTIHLPSEFWMESRRIGGRNKTGDKLTRDIEVLEKGVVDEPNNERYMFYLGQSYRDNNNIPKAIEWYTKRFNFGGWYEETYIAGLNVARLTKSKEWAWKAHQTNPKRIECLVSYMTHCRANNIWSQELYAMAKYATTIPMPTDQKLFLETEIYTWRVWDEFSIIAYHMGHRDEAYWASKKLLNNPSVPEVHRARILANSVCGQPSDSIIPVRRHDTGFYWNGIHSNCAYNGEIMQFIREAERKLDTRLSIFVEDSDGIVDTVAYASLSEMSRKHVRLETNIKFELKPRTKQVIAVLASRNVFRRDLFLIPFDDEIFKNGLSLGQIPSWKERQSKAVWRGKENGSDTRVATVKMLESHRYSDVKFAKYDRTNFLDCRQQTNYKYILSIDGTCIASSHQWVFGSGAVPIIITHPGNNFWFKSHLKDRENCVIIKYDLSNLCQTIEWLVEHDSEAEQIAKNALELSKRIFTPEFQRDYIEKELRSIVE